ncbi:MAG TPA: DUF4349 domain-containing protein [Actinomycetota bacterium]|jgi:uncharacterized membrane protein YphA (DoxX/SURF4 family)|nr:DUF4349 domain-containing protein [Actinomycetota bacterium]
MRKDIETDIRMALDAKAHEVELPSGLADRTLKAAREAARPTLRERLRGLTDAWRLRAPVTGYPRWIYAGGAVATAVLLFAVGTLVRTDPVLDRPVAEPAIAGPTILEDSSGRIGRDEGTGAEDTGGELKPAPAEGGGAGGSSPGAATTQIAPVPPVPGGRPGQFPPKIVRTANIDVQVDSFDAAWSRANALATTYGGFVTSSQASIERGTITMRVPAAKLEKALADLRKLGKVIQSTTTAEDVSAQIVDIDARLRVLSAEEAQLLELLGRASGVSQVLEVRDRLNAVRQESESLKAQKEYFASQVDYATINATVFERGADDPGEPGDDGILLEAWRTALRAGLTIIAGLLVVLGGLIPLTALGLAVWFAVRTLRRRSA